MQQQFKKGDRVIVRPVAYPMQRYEGVVQQRRPRGGYVVRVDVGGVMVREKYEAAEVAAQ